MSSNAPTAFVHPLYSRVSLSDATTCTAEISRWKPLLLMLGFLSLLATVEELNCNTIPICSLPSVTYRKYCNKLSCSSPFHQPLWYCFCKYSLPHSSNRPTVRSIDRSMDGCILVDLHLQQEQEGPRVDFDGCVWSRDQRDSVQNLIGAFGSWKLATNHVDSA